MYANPCGPSGPGLNAGVFVSTVHDESDVDVDVELSAIAGTLNARMLNTETAVAVPPTAPLRPLFLCPVAPSQGFIHHPVTYLRYAGQINDIEEFPSCQPFLKRF